MGKEKRMPALRFPGFEAEWERKKLREISTKITDGTHNTPKQTKEGVPFLTAIHIKDGFIDYDNCYFVSESEHKIIYDRCNPEKDDLLMVNIGAGTATCAKNLVSYEFSMKNVALIKPDYLHIYPDFLAHAQRKNSAKVFNQISSGGAQPFLSLDEISKIQISFPTLPEQQKIASFFTAIDQKISLLKQQKSLLEQYKKGIMQKIFSQELRFRDDNGKEFPEWEEKRLGRFMVERNIQEPKNEKYPLMAFVANKGVTPKGDRYNREFLVNDEQNKKYKQTEFGDFIYSSNNLETGSIGLNNYGSASISPVYSIFKIKELCNYQFIGIFLNSKEFIGKMIRYRQGVVYGQWRIHETAFLQIKVKLPSLSEQTKIANFLSALDEKIRLVQSKIEKMELWKKGLLQKMFC